MQRSYKNDMPCHRRAEFKFSNNVSDINLFGCKVVEPMMYNLVTFLPSKSRYCINFLNIAGIREYLQRL